MLFQVYDLAFDKAKDMLLKNRVALEKIVEELLEFEIMTGKVKSFSRHITQFTSTTQCST